VRAAPGGNIQGVTPYNEGPNIRIYRLINWLKVDDCYMLVSTLIWCLLHLNRAVFAGGSQGV